VITSTSYNSLTFDEKVEVLWSRGRLLIANKFKKFDRSLYAVDNFFVEVLYNKKDENIQEIKLVDNKKKLKFYIKQINIRSLFKMK
jgi:hypothetical protein